MYKVFTCIKESIKIIKYYLVPVTFLGFTLFLGLIIVFTEKLCYNHLYLIYSEIAIGGLVSTSPIGSITEPLREVIWQDRSA